MNHLIQGQKLKLSDLTASLELTLTLSTVGTTPDSDARARLDSDARARLDSDARARLDSDARARLDSEARAGLDYDVSCFGLDAAGKLSDERYMVYFNQMQTPEGAVKLERGRGSTRFVLDLLRLPVKVERLVFTLSVDAPHTLKTLSNASLSLSSGGRELAYFDFVGNLHNERALMVFEIYRRGEWRLAAVAQGFEGGLEQLLTHFGGQVSRPVTAPVSPPPVISPPVISPPVISPLAPPRAAPVPVPSPTLTPAPAILPRAPLSLTKITLAKPGDSARIDLRKGEAQPLHVNLNWDRPKPGFLGMTRAGADLDLACLYQLKDGQIGIVQALGNVFGRKGAYPHIYLDQDDRTGAVTGGENLYLERPDLIERVLIYAFIYGGSAKGFREVGGRLLLQDPQGNEIKVFLDNPSSHLTCCAVALLEQTAGQLKISKEERYFASQEPMSQHYRWGLRWTGGSKD